MDDQTLAKLRAIETLIGNAATHPGAELGEELAVPVRGGRLLPSHVLVTGTVRPFVLADVERELGTSLVDGFFGAWRGRPASVARSTRWVPGC